MQKPRLLLIITFLKVNSINVKIVALYSICNYGAIKLWENSWLLQINYGWGKVDTEAVDGHASHPYLHPDAWGETMRCRTIQSQWYSEGYWTVAAMLMLDVSQKLCWTERIVSEDKKWQEKYIYRLTTGVNSMIWCIDLKREVVFLPSWGRSILLKHFLFRSCYVMLLIA